MTTAKRHIKSVKSVWGAIENIFTYFINYFSYFTKYFSYFTKYFSYFSKPKLDSQHTSEAVRPDVPEQDDDSDDRYNTALTDLEQTQDKISGSASRSYDKSQNIAIKTAEELQRREETLCRTERNLDNMSQYMKTSNRHIKSVRSNWGATGNYFSYFSKPKHDPQHTSKRVKPDVPKQGDDSESDTALSYLERKARKRILASTSRSLKLIEESHNIAIKTAEELQRQEETLYRTEQNSDMLRDITTANRHIKSVKSVWGTIGNYFSKPKNDPTHTSEPVKPEVPERSLNMDADIKLDYGEQDYLSEYSGKGRGTATFERQYDNHLSEISRGLSILKDDALVLGQTIDQIYGRVQGKVEKVDDEIGLADRKIRKILRN